MNSQGVATTTAFTAVTKEMKQAIQPLLKENQITMSEYLRLCIVYARDNGQAAYRSPG